MLATKEAAGLGSGAAQDALKSFTKESIDSKIYSQEKIQSPNNESESSLDENFTKISNGLLDYGMQLFSPPEFKIFLFIWRKTVGWGKKADQISYGQMVKGTGLTRPTAIKGIKRLVAQEYILQIKSKDKVGDDAPSTYSINHPHLERKLRDREATLSSSKENLLGSQAPLPRVVKSIYQGSQAPLPRGGKNPLPTKEREYKIKPTQETKTEDISFSSSSPTSSSPPPNRDLGKEEGGEEPCKKGKIKNLSDLDPPATLDELEKAEQALDKRRSYKPVGDPQGWKVTHIERERSGQEVKRQAEKREDERRESVREQRICARMESLLGDAEKERQLARDLAVQEEQQKKKRAYQKKS